MRKTGCFVLVDAAGPFPGGRVRHGPRRHRSGCPLCRPGGRPRLHRRLQGARPEGACGRGRGSHRREFHARFVQCRPGPADCRLAPGGPGGGRDLAGKPCAAGLVGHAGDPGVCRAAHSRVRWGAMAGGAGLGHDGAARAAGAGATHPVLGRNARPRHHPRPVRGQALGAVPRRPRIAAAASRAIGAVAARAARHRPFAQARGAAAPGHGGAAGAVRHGGSKAGVRRAAARDG